MTGQRAEDPSHLLILFEKVLGMKTFRFSSGIAAVAVVVWAVGGCTVGPDYQRPQMDLPEQWSAEDVTAHVDPETLTHWWTAFDDPVLISLIEQADANSLDLQAALARIEQSRALRAFAAGEKLPSLEASRSYTRTRASAKSPQAIPGGGSPGEQSLYTSRFDAFWEIDVFGRIRRSVEAADAELERSWEDYHDVRLSLFAEVARNYIELRTAQMRLHYARANVEIQRQTLRLTQNRYEAEIAPELDVSQARLVLANTEAEIPSLRIAETAAINRLAVLAGTTPHDLREILAITGTLPEIQALPGAGVPAELLRRRPDIRSAERALAAQTARIGIATSQRYPSFSLAGMLGFQATHFSDMTNWDSRMYSFGPQMRWLLFDGFRVTSLIAVEDARSQQLAAAYESTVLHAVEEVENALIGLAQEQQRAEALVRSVEAARDALEKVETLYRSGLADFQRVLDVQRSLALQEDRLAISEGLVLQQAVALYKALGGGWDDGDIADDGLDSP